MTPAAEGRPLGRPPGGGNTADKARRALLDAAEQSFATRGFRASTMEVIAADAGRSRASIYRQFPSRKSLLEALVLRTIERAGQTVFERLPPKPTVADMITEGLVVTATELVRDPMIRTISEQSEEGGVAYLIGTNSNLANAVETLITPMVTGGEDIFRKGLHPRDIGQFLITTGITLLLELVAGAQDPGIARNYVEAFVLPAILHTPPAVRRVFPAP